MEILYSARNSTEYIAFETELDGFRILRNDRAVADAAMSAIGELAQHSDGYHRVPLTDALIAAAAAEHGGIAVLHRDTHFDKLAEVLTFENVELPEPCPASQRPDEHRSHQPSTRRVGIVLSDSVTPGSPHARNARLSMRERPYGGSGDRGIQRLG